MIRLQPLTSTNSSSLNGSATVTGGNIIMPSDISDAETTMSMIRNGMKMTNPMMNAARSSDRTNAGMSRELNGGHTIIQAPVRAAPSMRASSSAVGTLKFIGTRPPAP